MIAKYSSSRIIRQLLSVITTFLQPKLLSPDLFGLWTLLKIIPSYAGYLHFGSRTAMRFLIPQHQERGEYEKVAEIKNTVFTASLVLHLVAGFILILLSLLTGWHTATRVGLACMAFIILLQFFFEFYISNLKAEENFQSISRSNYIFSLASFLFSITLLYFFRIYGLFAAIILTYIVVIYYFYRSYRMEICVRFEKNIFVDLLQQGSPVMLTNLIILLIMTSDRFIVSWMLGQSSLGHYGIAILLLSFLMNVPGAAREVLEPQLMRELRQANRTEMSIKYLIKPMNKMLYFLPLAIGASYLSMPLFIYIFLPRYSEGIKAAQILLFGAYFLALSHPPRNLIIAFSLQKKALSYLPLIFLFNVILSILLIRLGYGIEGVAVSSTVSFALIPASQLLIMKNFLPSRMIDRGRYYGSLMLPPAVLLLLLYCCSSIFAQYQSSIWSCLGSLATSLIILFIVQQILQNLVLQPYERS